MSRHVHLLFITLAAVTALLGGRAPRVSHAAEEPKKNLSLEVVYKGDAGVTCLVDLYHEGKHLRTRELRFGLSTGKSDETVTWDKLAPGRYELHFSARGYKTLIKRVILTEGDTMPTIRAEVSKEDVTVGSGVSLQALETKLQELQKANKDLQTQVEALKAEVEKLKKK